MRTSRTLKRSALTALILAQASIHAAKAQAIDTEYMLPLPNGTNLIEASGALNTANAFHFTNGQDAHDSSLTEYDFDFRFAHYMDIEGYTAGIQLFQTAAYTSNLKVGGVSTNGQGVATLGAGNTTFSAFFFPYQTKEEEKKTDVFTAVYLTTVAPISAPRRPIARRSGRSMSGRRLWGRPSATPACSAAPRPSPARPAPPAPTPATSASASGRRRPTGGTRTR